MLKSDVAGVISSVCMVIGIVLIIVLPFRSCDNRKIKIAVEETKQIGIGWKVDSLHYVINKK